LEKLRISRLGTPIQIAAECGRLYRRYMREEIDGERARVGAYVLSVAHRCLVDAVLEQRVVELEASAKASKVLPFRRSA
jgi:hypothetical protein